jgi:hypothetical protein
VRGGVAKLRARRYGEDELIGLANAAGRDDAEKHIADIKRWLRL